MPLEISKPKVLQEANGRVRLSAAVTFPDKTEEIFFETKEEWAEHFVTDRLDAFVLVLFPYAMKTGQDIVCHAPLSIELLEKINDSLIPTLSTFIKQYNKIRICAETTNEKVVSKPLCVTGFSGGLDSMYTVYTLKERIENFKILASFDAGVYEHDEHLAELDEAERTTSSFAEKIGMSFIGLSCNITDIVDEHYRSVLCFRLFACALALGKAWNRYIFSPTRSDMQKEICAEISESALPIMTYSCSTDYLRFEQYGGYIDRGTKMKVLSGAPAEYRDNIHVCLRDYVFGHKNCGYCKKCADFLYTAERNGVLDSFSSAFPVEEYKKNKIKIAVSSKVFKNVEEAGMLVSSEEDAVVMEKFEHQINAIQHVIDKKKDMLAAKVRENGIV